MLLSGYDFFRKYTDTQILLNFFLRICSVNCVLFVQIRRYTYKMTIFLKQIYLTVAQIELCLDAKHWDLFRNTFAKNIVLLCAK